MKRLVMSFVACLAISVAAIAQNVQISGVVNDPNGPLPGATVMVQGTTNGVATDVDGKYTLTVPANATIVVSCIGYKDEVVEVNGRKVINVTLKEDATLIEETVLVGYGSSKKVTSLVGSIQTVKSDVLKNAPSSSALDQLQGQVAGLSVLTSSGVAGDNAVSMTLHGVGSIGAGSTPLYVIDGIPSSSRAIMAMNPNDIESVSVLKDAAATSIYGARAANGVIYVITKAGSYSEKANVTVRSQFGVSTLASLKLYKNMMSGDELKNFWIRSGIKTEAEIKATYTDKGYDYNTKWYEIAMDLVTPQYQNDVTVSGGGKKVSYMFSGSQFHQKGFTPGNFYNRYTLRSNVQAHPVDWLKAGTTLNLALDSRQQNPNWGSAGNTSNYTSGGLSFLLNPLFPEIDETTGKRFEKKFKGSNFMNPDYYMESNKDKYNRYGANGSIFLEIEPVRNLKFVSRAGVDGYITLNNWKTLPSYTKYTSGTANGLIGKATDFSYAATITNTLEYSFDIADKHEISVLAGHEGVANDYRRYYAQSKGLTDDRIMRLQDGLASTYTVSQSMSESRFLSFFGHADYTFDKRYIADFTVRNDASSRFGKDVRSATFWSAGFRWNAKRESFLKGVKNINALDVKLSYGTQGNAAIGDYSSLGLVAKEGTYKEASGLALTQPANDLLTWEKQQLFTVGVSGRFFNMVDAEVEFYSRKTTDMLMDVPNPYTTGIPEATQNVGALTNNGIDITLGVDIYRSRDAYARFSTTFNYNSQKIKELFDGRDRWEIANTMVAYVVGKPIAFYLPLFAGIDPEDGKQMWYLPGDNVDVCTKDPSRVTKVFDEASLTQNSGKSRYAPINGGFSFSGGWKGFAIQADFSYVLGKYLVSNDGFFYGNPAYFPTMNTNKAVSDFWTPDNRNAKYPDWSTGAQMEFDSHLLENASFLRLKNFQVAYTLPAAALKWSDGVLKTVKFTVTGRNLLTFTKYSGIDPEVNSNLTYGIPGNSKQVLGGIEITF